MNQDPKLASAFYKAIKAYFDDHDLTEYNKSVGGERKLDKKYLDNLDRELNPTEEDKKLKELEEKKTKKKSSKSSQLRVK